ncbi:peptidase S58 DmpA [Ketogulonicigenium robustum]|uniref:Peptidase S58 DmpA n=1 Tax=Ketogulonicigenium robustum TaxID=92947 RepID=A0A1W6P2G4_9RHOB|nr:P1 family peptidase [Ketogulonicigenium robustum]ARO15705.1 peptidase S58 DmpA [Ketogulonicigenium robustum]
MDRRSFGATMLGLGAAGASLLHATSASASGELPPLLEGCITDVPGIKLGHHVMEGRPTGCSVILCEEGARAGVDVRGSAPGTRETDLLNPINMVNTVNAILLSGGSAYGLDAAGGVMRWLEERGMGHDVGRGVVPIVPAAILFDLGVGDFSIRPDAAAGYAACDAATDQPSALGNVGAGAGATIGKMFRGSSMKGGLGTASYTVPGTNIVVAAIVAVNAVGDVIDPRTGQIVAGALNEDRTAFRDTQAQIMNGHTVIRSAAQNTTIGAVVTNAPFTKTEMNKVAQMAHDGYARAISPVHTMSDGDTIFALSTGKSDGVTASVNAIGTIGAVVMAHAIVRAVMAAESLSDPDIPAYKDIAFSTAL